MKLPAQSHVAVVDGERFLLMRNCGTTAAPVLECESEPSVVETNRSAGVRHQDGTRAATVEPLDKFAHAAGVADWLNHQVLTNRIKQLLVIADPDTLGEMRLHYHKKTQDALLGELAKQLTGRPGPDILKAIAAA